MHSSAIKGLRLNMVNEAATYNAPLQWQSGLILEVDTDSGELGVTWNGTHLTEVDKPDLDDYTYAPR